MKTIADSSGNLHLAKGAPPQVAGRFAGRVSARQGSALTLDDTTPGTIRSYADYAEARRLELAVQGYRRAAFGPRLAHKRRDEARAFWAEMDARAEVAPDSVDDTAKLPVFSENTGKRIRRMKYTIAGSTVRMPSRSQIEKFAAAGNSTFDIPVEVSGKDGQNIVAWARVHKAGPGDWYVSLPGQNGGVADAEAARAIACVTATLSSTRVATMATEFGDEKALRELWGRRQQLAERLRAEAQQKAADEQRRKAEAERHAGAALVALDNSDWVHAFGWNPHHQELILDLNGRKYGYYADENIVHRITTTTSVGRTYNHFIKGVLPGFEATECPDCETWFNAEREHACRPTARKSVVRRDAYTDYLRRQSQAL